MPLPIPEDRGELSTSAAPSEPTDADDTNSWWPFVDDETEMSPRTEAVDEPEPRAWWAFGRRRTAQPVAESEALLPTAPVPWAVPTAPLPSAAPTLDTESLQPAPDDLRHQVPFAPMPASHAASIDGRNAVTPERSPRTRRLWWSLLGAGVAAVLVAGVIITVGAMAPSASAVPTGTGATSVPAASTAQQPHRVVRGTVAAHSATSVTIRRADGQLLTLAITASTRFGTRAKPARQLAVAVGGRVTAVTTDVDGSSVPTARRIIPLGGARGDRTPNGAGSDADGLASAGSVSNS